MGNSSSKGSNSKINKLYNLFDEDSIFHVNKDGFLELANKIKNKELDILKNKIFKLNTKLTEIETMDINEYVQVKLLDKDKKIDKEQFIKLLKLFSNDEFNQILKETKKKIFLNLRNEFE
tara:strand:+ start:220 stop:579 length:360 start_codon:yes stop_codon:yes gene_type:complete